MPTTFRSQVTTSQANRLAPRQSKLRPNTEVRVDAAPCASPKPISGPPLQQLIQSPLGILRATWTEVGLWSLELLGNDHHVSCSNIAGANQAGSSSELLGSEFSDSHLLGSQRLLHHELDLAIKHYFASGHMRWNLDLLDWNAVSAFHRLALRRCFQIPPGETLTYGQLATAVGSPKAARAIGGAMARNRWPLLIPCHRVVGSSGKLTGYSGIGGVVTKRKLLEFEATGQGFA